MPPARKKTVAKTAPVRTASGEPLLELVTDDTEQKPVPMEPAFTINGRVISVPVEVDAAVAIRYMDHCRKKGENWGLSWLLEEVLGTEAYEALLALKGLKDEHIIAVARIVQSKVLGDTAPKG